MSALRTSRGRKIVLGRRVNKGGEGTVYEVSGGRSLRDVLVGRRLLAKTYHQGCSPVTEAKLKAMLAISPVEPTFGHTSIAWPMDTVYDNGVCIGYIMPHVRGAVTTIFNFQHAAARRKRFPGYERRDIYQMGINLASAVELIHHVGHVVGDLNEANILARPNGLITLIDTDSFQINDGRGHIYRCCVGKEELIAPEIQGMRRGEFDWRPEHDRFALAVHLFHLLVGDHPFEGVLKNGTQINGLSLHLIKNGAFPYAPNALANPPPSMVPSYARLSPYVQQAFVRAFVDGYRNPASRPSAQEWGFLLHGARLALRRCRKCGAHNEPHMTACYECGVAQPVIPIGRQSRSGRWKQKLADKWRSYLPRTAGAAILLVIVGIFILAGWWGRHPKQTSASASIVQPTAASPNPTVAIHLPSTPASPAVQPSPTSDPLPPSLPPRVETRKNVLGMRFVKVPGISGLVSIWPTRVQDFRAFIRSSRYDPQLEKPSASLEMATETPATWENPGFPQDPDDPVVCVTWQSANAFCNWLTDQDRGPSHLKFTQHYRLPTDLEWSRLVGLSAETGASPRDRSGRIKGVYPWGPAWPPPAGAGNFRRTANPAGRSADHENSFAHTSPVGSFPSNKYGLYDLCGNVWEWCSDAYSPPRSARVLRGGSWRESAAEDLLSSKRRAEAENICDNNIGFRCILDLGPANL